MSLNGGYAMIKYNSTQEELQIAYRSKKPALFYDENQRAHWAVIEETATQSVDEETQEPITLYKYSYRLIDEASGGVATLDDIVDKNGNKRFVEGEGISSLEGMTVKYNKWSLSGTHLMFVLSFVTTGTIEQYSILMTYNLPDYIRNKIVAVSFNDLVCTKSEVSMDVHNDQRKFEIKKVGNEIRLDTFSNINPGREYRVQIDLLIDSE